MKDQIILIMSKGYQVIAKQNVQQAITFYQTTAQSKTDGCGVWSSRCRSFKVGTIYTKFSFNPFISLYTVLDLKRVKKLTYMY